MSEKLIKSLMEKCDKYEVVFWYDKDQEFKEVFENLDFDQITKIKIDQNEFETKYILTNKSKEDKYILYFDYQKPNSEDNWLLDLELAYYTFHTDQVAIILQELQLDYAFKDLIQEHIKFFDAKQRVAHLKRLLEKGDSHHAVRSKMLAVIFNSDAVDINYYVLVHAQHFSENSDQIEKDLSRYKLEKFYWEQIYKRYHFNNKTPKIYDFLIEIFTSSDVIEGDFLLNNEAKYLLSMWKDSMAFRDSYIDISERIAKDLNVEKLLQDQIIDNIIDDDTFELNDRKVIFELTQRILHDDISNASIQNLIKRRENTFWYNNFVTFYNALSYASHLHHLIKSSKYNYERIENGMEVYAKSLYKIDFYYRKFILSYRKSQHNSLLNKLAESIEKLYTNKWLLLFNNQWQEIINKLERWPIATPLSQRNFFKKYVQPYIDKNQRIFVIISDALRFECGKELSDSIKSENRFDSTINYMLSSLPSYTQLGMASLLPHQNLALKDGTDAIIVDGTNSSGVSARAKILESYSEAKATAITATKFLQMNTKIEGRNFVKKYDVIYIYHNRIDKVGDDKTTEDKLVEAVEEEIIYIKDIIKKVANVNGYNMIITSDHGFLYQYQDINHSDFIELENSDELNKVNRRFAIGENISNYPSLKNFQLGEVGLDGNEKGMIAIPYSIGKLRVKGSGSKFVHGGATLQETVIPVIQVNKKRQDTTEKVDVDIIKSSDRITTNILVVSFIQCKAVTKTSLPREIRASIQSEDKVTLSDIFKYTFDNRQENQRQREVTHRFQLTSLASTKYKNQRVALVLEEPVDQSNHWRVYKKFYYTLNISFSNDFDDF